MDEEDDWLGTVQDSTAAPPCSCKRSFTQSFSKQCSRFERWERSSGAKDVTQPGRYATMLEEICKGSPHLSAEKEKQLQVDVERTCPTLTFFSEGCSGRASLHNLLRAWVVFDAQEADAGGSQAVGYVQGMNFLVTILLWHAASEEDAFWVFVAMMQNYGMRCMFEPPDMYGLKMRSSTMAQLLHQEMPQLSDHLAEYLRNSFSLLITEWLLTLFAGSVPLGPLAAFWDHFFEDGYRSVYRLILARLRCLAPALLAETDFATLVYLIKSAHVDFDHSSGEPKPLPPALPQGFMGCAMEGAVETQNRRRSSRNLLKRWVNHARRHFERDIPKDIELTTSSPTYPGEPDGSETGAWTCMQCNGSESCRSWEVLVNVLLVAEGISDTSVRHYEEMFGSMTPKGKEALPSTMSAFLEEASGEERQKIVAGTSLDHSRDPPQPSAGSKNGQDDHSPTKTSVADGAVEVHKSSSREDIPLMNGFVADCIRGAGPATPPAAEVEEDCSRDDLREENARLREENDELRSQLAAVQAQLTTAEQEISRLQQRRE